MAYRVIYNENKLGRPFEITEEDVEVISDNFNKTLVMTTVAGLSGRHVQTIEGWLRQGEADYMNSTDTLFRNLYINVKAAIATRILTLEQKIENNETGWQRFSWLLERTVRKEYSQYGDLIDEVQTKIAELAERIAGRDKASPRELTLDVKNWIKDGIKAKKEEYRG